MQCVLDIDLDFFVKEIKTWGNPKERLCDREYPCEDWHEVQTFLESQCGLSKTSPIKGKVFEYHHEVFKWWRQQIQTGELRAPFHCIHVDAHSDLGMGDASYFYIGTELLHLPPAKRIYPNEGGWSGLSEGNFLAFALACEWIGRLTMVLHNEPIEDQPAFFFKNFDPLSGAVSLKRCTDQALQAALDRMNIPSLTYELSHEVPCKSVERAEFTAPKKIDFICLTRSPGYTPKAADTIFDGITQYIAL
jgi:hypothetical protein